jgi:hypothetical protein
VLLCVVDTADANCVDASARGGEGTNLIWEGPPTIALASLARCAAPVLWFAPGETDYPRQLAGVGVLRAMGGLPARKPFVVYYQLQRLSGGHAGRKNDSTQITLESNGVIVLRFLLYYDRDATHLHDLERVDIHLRTVRTLARPTGAPAVDSGTAKVREHVENSPDRWLLWPERIVALAHGNVWYSNERALPRRAEAILWRPTLLVENGKHGMAPDRDANGAYTPFIDVNRRVSDAWGLRDSLASKSGFLAPAYSADVTTPRAPDGRRTPDDYDLVELQDDFSMAMHQCQTMPNPYVMIDGWDYCGALRRAYRAPDSASLGVSALRRFARQFTSDPTVAATEDARLFDSIAASVGRDADLWRGTFVPRAFELSKLSGWLIPRLRVLDGASGKPRFQATLGYSPSAGRWADWYIDAGYGTAERLDGDDRWRPCFGCGPIAEFGFRWKVPTDAGLVGARLGIATDYASSKSNVFSHSSSFPHMSRRRFRNVRVVYDLTIGPW